MTQHTPEPTAEILRDWADYMDNPSLLRPDGIPPTALPGMYEELAQLRQDKAELLEALGSIAEHDGGYNIMSEPLCPICSNSIGHGHDVGCPFPNAKAAYETIIAKHGKES